MKKKLVSVVTVSYRNIEGIYKTVDSVLLQDYPQIEIVISDDGTPGFEKHINRIKKYINNNQKGNIVNVIVNSIKKNCGTVKNCNQAISLANGYYIKELSADDTLNSPYVISEYVSFMEENDFYICFAKVRGVTPQGKYLTELQACENNYDYLKSLSPHQTADKLFARNMLPAPASFMKKELFDKYGKYDEDIRLIEDYPYWIILSLQGVKFGFLDKVFVDYPQYGESSGHIYSKAFMQDLILIYDKYVFPNDKRFGKLQSFYNFLKRKGLDFYMRRSEWNDYCLAKKLIIYHMYFPFFVYAKVSDEIYRLKNK